MKTFPAPLYGSRPGFSKFRADYKSRFFHVDLIFVSENLKSMKIFFCSALIGSEPRSFQFRLDYKLHFFQVVKILIWALLGKGLRGQCVQHDVLEKNVRMQALSHSAA